MDDFDKEKLNTGLLLLENIADLMYEDIRIGQAIAVCLNEDDDLFTIENKVLLERIRGVRGIKTHE